MQKIDSVVKSETKYISLFVIILSALMQSVFLIIGKWDYTVLLGNLLSASAAVLNFFFMGLTVQKAVSKDEEKQSANVMKLSHTLRMMFLFIAVIIGVLVPLFNIWTVIIPLFFPRIAVSLRPLFERKQK